jgi:hypothetical protein
MAVRAFVLADLALLSVALAFAFAALAFMSVALAFLFAELAFMSVALAFVLAELASLSVAPVSTCRAPVLLFFPVAERTAVVAVHATHSGDGSSQLPFCLPHPPRGPLDSVLRSNLAIGGQELDTLRPWLGVVGGGLMPRSSTLLLI